MAMADVAKSSGQLEEMRACLSLLQHELMCSICRSIVRKPYSLPCHHFFCQHCVDKVAGSKCPICKEKYSRREKIPAQTIADIAKAYRRLHGLTFESLDMPMLSQDSAGLSASQMGPSPPRVFLPPAAVAAGAGTGSSGGRGKSRARARKTADAIVTASPATATTASPSTTATSPRANTTATTATPSSAPSTPMQADAEQRHSTPPSSVSSTSSAASSVASSAAPSPAPSTPAVSTATPQSSAGTPAQPSPASAAASATPTAGTAAAALLRKRSSTGKPPVPLFSSGTVKLNEQPATFSPPPPPPPSAAVSRSGTNSAAATGTADAAASGDDERCSVCWEAEAEEDNQLIACDGCGVWVHQYCYGVETIPKGQWFCEPCARFGAARSGTEAATVRCCVCPNTFDRAYKPTVDGRWIHTACALWLTGPEFVNSRTQTPVKFVDRIDAARFRLKCQFCKEPGACLQCTHKGCWTSYHVPCGRRNGIMFTLFDGPETDVYFHTRCHEHRAIDAKQLVNNSRAFTRKRSTGSKSSGKKKGRGRNRKQKDWDMDEDEHVRARDVSVGDEEEAFNDWYDDENEVLPKAMRTGRSSSDSKADAVDGAAEKGRRKRKSASTGDVHDAFAFESGDKRAAGTSAAATGNAESDATERKAKRSKTASPATTAVAAPSFATAPASGSESGAAKKMVLLPTKLDEKQSQILKRAASLLGATVTQQFSSEVTHIVTNARNAGGRILPARTSKYFLGLLGGQHLVTFDWVADSQTKRMWRDERDYTVRGDSKSLGGPERSRAAHQNGEAVLFAGYQFVLIGRFDPTMEADMKAIIQHSGAVLRNQLPIGTADQAFQAQLRGRKWVVIYGNKSPKSGGAAAAGDSADGLSSAVIDFVRTHSIPVSTPSWLFDSVSQYSILPFPPAPNALTGGPPAAAAGAADKPASDASPARTK